MLTHASENEATIESFNRNAAMEEEIVRQKGSYEVGGAGGGGARWCRRCQGDV